MEVLPRSPLPEPRYSSCRAFSLVEYLQGLIQMSLGCPLRQQESVFSSTTIRHTFKLCSERWKLRACRTANVPKRSLSKYRRSSLAGLAGERASLRPTKRGSFELLVCRGLWIRLPTNTTPLKPSFVHAVDAITAVTSGLMKLKTLGQRGTAQLP